MANYSFAAQLRLESTTLLADDGIFDAALELELNCIRKEAWDAHKDAVLKRARLRKAVQEADDAEVQNHSST